jgi:hypothetical protein
VPTRASLFVPSLTAHSQTSSIQSAKNRPPDSANLRSVLKPDFPVAFVQRIRPPNIIRLTIRKQMDAQQKVARVANRLKAKQLPKICQDQYS